MLSTNLGLLQVNIKWALTKYGSEYHWVKEVYSRLNLPLYPGIVEALEQANQSRLKTIERTASKQYKSYRVSRKQARVLEEEERKK